MKLKRVYHGWIFRERQEGIKDFFSIQCDGEVHPMGYGETGATAAVRFFEETKRLGAVKLEQTPIGLRVFCEED